MKTHDAATSASLDAIPTTPVEQHLRELTDLMGLWFGLCSKPVGNAHSLSLLIQRIEEIQGDLRLWGIQIPSTYEQQILLAQKYPDDWLDVPFTEEERKCFEQDTKSAVPWDNIVPNTRPHLPLLSRNWTRYEY